MSGPTSVTSSSRSTDFGSPASDAVDPQPGPQPVDQLLGRRDADVGGQQGVLDRLPGVLVEAVARQQRQQPAAEAALRAGQPLAQPDQPRRRPSRASRRVGSGAAPRRAGRRPPATSVSARGGEMTSVPCVGAGTACAAPPARQQAGQQADRDDGDADDQVQPVTHGDHPTSRRIRRGVRRGAGPDRCPVAGRRPARSASGDRSRRLGGRATVDGHRRRRARRSTVGSDRGAPCASGVPATAHRAGPRRGAGRRRTTTTTPASSTITTIATTI